MRRRLLLLAGLPFAFAACGGPRADTADSPDTARYVDAMAREHAHDASVASPAALGEPRQEVVTSEPVYGLVDGERVKGYLAEPASAGRSGSATLPAVILVHEWWGLNDQIKSMARQLAGEGYRVLAVDMYHGRVASTPQEAQGLMRTVMDDLDRGVAHMMSAALYLKQEKKSGQVGVLGWCFGGAWALQSALFMPEQVDAAVMYYGRVTSDREQLAKLDAPLLGHFGATDRGIPVDSVRAMEGALKALGKDVAVHVYEGAGHAFANPTGQAYDAEAARVAWDRTLAFFRAHLKE